MSTQSSLAQNTMDLYYQQYASDEDFFKIYHFKYLNGITYAALLQAEYEKSYAKNLAETGIGMATISDDWFCHETVQLVRATEIGQFVTQLKCHKIFSFRYDRQDTGLKDVIALNGSCGDFIRLRFIERWKLQLLPEGTPEIYYFPLGNKIYFSNITCGLSKAIVVYIPALNMLDDIDIAPTLEADIVQGTLNLMFAARQGKPVIDTTNDGNPNATMETEINEKFEKIRK